MKEDFGALTKDDIILLFLFDHDFKISQIRADDVGYIFYVFDIQYQQTFQPIKLELKFDRFVSSDINSYVLVLTNKIVSIGSDGQRYFDLIFFSFFETPSFFFSILTVFLSVRLHYNALLNCQCHNLESYS